MLLDHENLVSYKLVRVKFPTKLRFQVLADVCEVSFFSFTSNDNIFIRVNLFNMLNFGFTLVSLWERLLGSGYLSMVFWFFVLHHPWLSHVLMPSWKMNTNFRLNKEMLTNPFLFFFCQNYYCRCRANFRCYYYGYYGRKCCGWVYQQPGCSRCQESQCCSNNVCKPLRKPGEACPLKRVITTDIMNSQQVKVDLSRLTLTRPFHLRSC